MLEDRVLLDVSAPPILQYDEGTYATIEQRVPDIFNAGYGTIFTPPPGRADSGNQSVGYDVYNRFDLGSPGNPTLYGTEEGLKALVSAIHTAGDSYYSDLVWNHDGFSDLNTPGFAASGGYPGFALSLTSNTNYAGYNNSTGDFHAYNDSSTTGMRLSGLIDIAQEDNYQFIRSPVGPNPMNIPAGTTPSNGRLANVPDPSNAQFYPDQSLPARVETDPALSNQTFTLYNFNNANPMNGTPVLENATGYLMRYTQWMVQTIGVDGFRLDAAKNMPPWVLNYFDLATYNASYRTLLNGQTEPIFGFSEVFDGNESLLQQYYLKNINPAQPNTVGGNRDVLDFPLYFALDNNLTNNGIQNNWNNVINASVDAADDGYANNGSEGVSFVSSADSPPPYLDNVAYAFTLTRPGNAIVYYNAQEFGTNRSFPRQGRGDALGGLYGNAITTLINIRDTHPDGNFIPRLTEQNVLVYERDNSMLVGLSNRLDSGYDSRTVHTDFAPGTYLIELTGNAASTTTDPDGAIPPLLQVDSNGNVNMRVPRNVNDSGVETDKGYVIYAPATPQGSLTLSNVNHVIPGQTPTSSTNGTAVLSSIDDITASSFQIQLNTNNVNLLGNPQFHDQDANGDNAIFKIDGGVDVTGNGFVSTNPGDVSYGFQQFTTVHNPGYFSSDGNGQYVQTIDTSKLSSGMHYITVRAFRHRSDGGPPIFTDFTQAIYVDHGPTVSALVSFLPTVSGVNQNQTLTVQSTDLLANNIHVMFDLPSTLTTAQILGLVSNANQATQTDRNLWTINENGLTNGNHVATVISYQIDGSANVQRFPGLLTSTIFGAGLGDVNFDDQYTSADLTEFGQILNGNNSQFNPAADLNGDGVIDNSDLLLLYPRLLSVGAGSATLAAYDSLLGPPASGYATDNGDGITLNANYPAGTAPALSFSWDLNHDGNFGDATGPTVNLTWSQLNFYGISGPGTYPISVRVTDGPYTDTFNTSITVNPPVAITTSALPDWTLDKGGYSQTIGTSGGSSPLTFQSTGTLPPGLMLTTGGALVGDPSATGSYTFTVTVTDALGSTSSHTYSVTIHPAVVISTASLPAWTAGLTSYNQSIAASGGTGTLTFASAGNLPTGLTLGSSGVLAGTPSAAGTYNFTVSATDSVGASALQNYTIVINPAVTVAATLPNWTINQGGFSQKINASGGTGSLTYSATGTLPPGLTLSNAGLLDGTPSSTGSFPFTVTATDSLGASGSSPFTIVINPPVSVAAASLATWTAGLPGYSQTIAASGGTGSLTFGVPTASLPPGLTFSSTGLLSGTPTSAGDFAITVTVTDATGATGTQSYTVQVNPAVAITTSTLPDWTVNIANYNQTISASGGTGTLAFGTTGTLPTGLSLSNAGVLAGTPTATGTFTFTVTATDSLGASASESYTVTVNIPLSLNPGILPAGLENVAYNKTIATLGGTGSVALMVSGLAGTIPGLNVPASATGNLPITGTPTATGTETFTVTATDSVGATTSTSYSLTINPATVYLTLPSTGFAGSPGGTISGFAISINALQDQATANHVGLASATIALSFSTGVFNFPIGGTSATPYVSLGSVPLSDTVAPGGAADWTLSAGAPADGQLNITLTAKSGKQITTDNPASGGSLVIVRFPLAATYNPTTPTAQTITVVAANNQVHTIIAGSNGNYVLEPAPPYTGSVTVNTALAITTTSLSDWTAGLAGYSQTISSAGGTGAVTFSASGTLPTGLSLNGNGILSGTSSTPGSYAFTVTGKDSSGASASQSYTVMINPPVAIATTSLPDGMTGSPYSQTISASGGTGTLTFSATGTLPAGLTLSSAGVLTGTPTKVGSYAFTVTAMDDVGASASQSFSITISGSAFSQYLVTVMGSSTVQAGTGFLVAVQAADSSGNPVTSYNGPATVTASISPTSSASNFPMTVAIDSSGLGLLLANLQQVGTYSITVATGPYSGSSTPVTVTPGPAVKLGFATEPVSTPTGVTLPAVAVQVLDPFGNVITSDNTDTLTLGIASGPGSFTTGSTKTATLHDGVATFSNLTLARPGSYALSAIIPGKLTGPNSATFTVAPLQVVSGSFTGTPSGFALQFNAPYLVNSTTPVLYGQGFGSTSSDPSVTLTQTRDSGGNPINNSIAGSLILNPATDSISFVATDTTLATNNGSPILPDGSYQAVVQSSAATDGFQALNAGGGFLDGLGTGTAGSGDFMTTFTISAAAAGDDVLWVPATADGPGLPLNAPGGNQLNAGYPIYLNDNTGSVTDVRVTLNYNPALLTVTGVTGADFTLQASSTAGQAVLEYSGPALPSGKTIPIGYVTATVPAGTTANPTPYKAKDLLHLSGVSLNGGAVPVTTSDAIHLVAYVGDADGNGSYTSNDAVLATRVVLQTDSGFVAYPLVDPTIVADTDGAGFIPADAALQINEAGVGVATANLPRPPIPGGVVFQAVPNNVDPMLSIPRVLTVGTNGIVAVPVNIDDPHPAGSTGLIEAHLALTYDPGVFTVSAADFHLGSVLTRAGGWTLVPAINTVSGQIAITLSSTTPVSSSLGGSLVTIDFHYTGASSGIPPIDLVASVNPTGQQVIRTELEDAQGSFTISF